MVLPTAAGKPCYGRDGISCRPSRQLFRERLAEIHFHEMYRNRLRCRWTKNVLFFLLDAAGYNAFVLEWSKLPQNFQRNKKRPRRLRLECLAEQLIAEQMKNRIKKWKATSFVGVPTYLREAAQRRKLLDASLDSEPPTNFGTGRCQ